MKISDEYHIYYDEYKLWEHTTWLGVPCWKLPLDMLIYQELIHKVKPDIIIETGTAFGGSALFFASVCDLIGKGGVLTIDVEDRTQEIQKQDHKVRELWNKRVQFLEGSSTAPHIIQGISDAVKKFDVQSVMVILDSWHSKEHVAEELELYSPLVSLGSYVIVEDTHIHNPLEWEWGPGPGEAVVEFLEGNEQFEIDEECEKLVMTFNPKGWLKRIK